MESRSKNLIINCIFTLLVVGTSMPLILESRIHFNKTASKSFLYSDFLNYKITNTESKKHIPITHQAKDSLLVGNKAIKNVEVIRDLHELEKSILPTKIIEDLYENPLLRGFYVQLGIFKTKEDATKVIEYLTEREFITEDYNTYIETKMLQAKDFYIPQIGVFSSKNEAIAFCNNLQKLQINCLIVD